MRITPATQEASTCVFEASSPKQAVELFERVGLRLLRFSLGGMFWRRAQSALSNPFLSPVSVYGLEPLRPDAKLLFQRSLDLELLIRGNGAVTTHPVLKNCQTMVTVPYARRTA